MNIFLIVCANQFFLWNTCLKVDHTQYYVITRNSEQTFVEFHIVVCEINHIFIPKYIYSKDFWCGLVRQPGWVLYQKKVLSVFRLNRIFVKMIFLLEYLKKKKYSGRHWRVCKCCFMKQKCHFQRGVSQ